MSGSTHAFGWPTSNTTSAASLNRDNVFEKPQNFDFRHDADLIADVQQRPITLGDAVEIGQLHVLCPGRWGGDAQAAHLAYKIHVAPGLFQTFGPAGVVIDDPLRKRDRADDLHSEIANSLAEIRERAAAMDMVFQFADPGFDCLIARLSGNVDQLRQRQLLPPQRAGVQPEMEGVRAPGGSAACAGSMFIIVLMAAVIPTAAVVPARRANCVAKNGRAMPPAFRRSTGADRSVDRRVNRQPRRDLTRKAFSTWSLV